MEVHDSTSVCLSSTAHRPPLLTLLVALRHRRRRRLLHLMLFQHVVQGDGSVERKSISIEFQSPFSYPLQFYPDIETAINTQMK